MKYLFEFNFFKKPKKKENDIHFDIDPYGEEDWVEKKEISYIVEYSCEKSLYRERSTALESAKVTLMLNNIIKKHKMLDYCENDILHYYTFEVWPKHGDKQILINYFNNGVLRGERFKIMSSKEN